jgi:hypothetical protein
MEPIVTFLSSISGIVVAVLVVLFLAGWFFLWRSRRKLRETT